MKLALPRLFSRLLVGATIASILSVIVFVGYVQIGAFAGAHAQSQAMWLYTTGIIGLIAAEACQILSIVTLVVQWVASKKLDKKPREIAVLILSLIPFMVILVLLATLVVYVNERRQSMTPERRKELEEEAKEITIDVLIDAGTNSTNTIAGNATGGVATATKPALSLRQMQSLHAIHRVVGPTAASNVAKLPGGLLPIVSVALVATVVTTGSVALSRFSPASSHVGTIHEFSLPTGISATSIASGPNGNLWFTSHGFGVNDGSRFSQITPKGNQLPVLTVSGNPLPGDGILDFTVGPDGNVWYIGLLGDIGRISLAGVITTFKLPSTDTGGRLTSITVGPDGNLWFTQKAGKVGRITIKGAIQIFNHLSGSAIGITAGPDGNLWVAEGGSKIARITLQDKITEFRIASGSDPTAIIRGPDGNLWFTEQANGKASPNAIGRITP